jgi:fluoride exporter
VTALAWLAAGVLGGAGAIARFLIDGAIAGRVGRDFPYGTFAINVSGAFILGLLDGAALSGTAATLAGTATIGSYTTFSTWMLETHRLRDDSQFSAAAANLLVSLFAGLAAAALGRLVGTQL